MLSEILAMLLMSHHPARATEGAGIRRRYEPETSRVSRAAAAAAAFLVLAWRSGCQSSFALEPSLFEEICDELDRGRGVFFHDPVAGIWHLALVHIRGRSAHHGCHHWAERFPATHSKYRHGQLALGHERFVVAGVLIEGFELLEAGVHRARLGIKLRIVRAGRVIEFFRIGRKLVPEAIEVDALASLYEALGIRAPEREMPERMAPNDILPRPDAGRRGIDQDKFRDAVGVKSRKRVANHVTDVVCDEVGLVDLQCVEHAGNIFGLRLLVVSAWRPRGEAHSTKVRNDDGVIADQLGGERCPHVASLAVAMQQYDCGAFAADADVNLGAVRGDRLSSKLCRKWLEGRLNGAPQKENENYAEATGNPTEDTGTAK